MKKQYRAYFVRQRDQSDCGAACLAMIIKYYTGFPRLEHLRTISGTTKQGATMLGLYQAAQKEGLSAEAYKADLENLKQIQQPCILHVVKEGYLLHYIVCFTYEKNRFIVADPAEGVKELSASELDKIWHSRALLTLSPTQDFRTDQPGKRYTHWQWFKSLIWQDTNLLGIAGVLSVFTTILGLVVPIFSQKLIDQILPEDHRLKLIIGLSLLCFLLLVRNGLNYLREYFLIWQTKDFNNRIIDRFYGSLLHLPKAFFDTRKVGELVARMNDTVRIQNAVRHLTTKIMVDIILVLIATVAILVYEPGLGLLVALYIPLYFGVTYYFHDEIVQRQRSVMQYFAQTESHYVDTIQGIGTIKSSNKEDYFSHKTRSIYNKFQSAIYNLGLVRIRFNLVTDIISSLIIVVLLSWGSFKVFQESLTLGAFMAIIQLVLLSMPAIGRIALTNVQLQEARVAFERMFEFSALPPEYKLEKEKQKTNIDDLQQVEIKDISFQFPGRSPLLQNVNLTLSKNKLVCLWGESGSGKSTLLQILQGFYSYEKGVIKVNGIPLSDYNLRDWRRVISYVPQQVKIFNGSLLYNIALSPKEAKQEAAKQFCEEKGFQSFFTDFPRGYNTILGEEGVNISGGQQQLVAIARALFQRPQLLLLDEATGAMDRRTENYILNVLQQLKPHMAILLVTHRLKIAKSVDYIYTLREKTIKASGNHGELLEQDKEYAQSWQELEE